MTDKTGMRGRADALGVHRGGRQVASPDWNPRGSWRPVPTINLMWYEGRGQGAGAGCVGWGR